MRIQIKLLLLLIALTLAKHQFAYTIRYSKSFSQSKIPQNVACSQKNVVYGNYIYPQGPVDVLYFLLNPHVYNVYLQCRNQKVFAKVFGTAQDYDVLLKTDPTIIAKNLQASVSMNNFIIEWKHSPEKEFLNSKKWLNSFIQALINLNKTVYLKAPASSFCFMNKKVIGESYLLGDIEATKFIVEMYGQQPGLYTSYDEIFGNPEDINQSMECQTYPTYSFLSRKFPQNEFFIEKTLHKEQAGYIGPNLNKFLQQAKSLYDKILFLDSYPAEIIDL